jgi:hypothetical protein
MGSPASSRVDFQETKRLGRGAIFIFGGEVTIKGVKSPHAMPAPDISSPKLEAIVLLAKPPFLSVFQLFGKEMRTPMKRKLGCVGLALILGYLFFFQLPYLIDPGLRDIHIRKKIKTLNKAECAEMANGCQKIYRAHIHSLSDDGYAQCEEIPAPASRVGYKTAIIHKENVTFLAGAGGFSQIGPIVIICWMDPETKTATDLALDDGRHFNPATGKFVTP